MNEQGNEVSIIENELFRVIKKTNVDSYWFDVQKKLSDEWVLFSSETKEEDAMRTYLLLVSG